VVRNQSRADVDRDDKDEEVLLLEELAKRFGRRREHRCLGILRADPELHGADDEGREREQHEAHERALPQERTDPRRRNHHPRASGHRPAAAIVPITLIVDGHYSSPIALANTSSSVGTLGRRCRTCTPKRAAALKIAW